MSWAQFRIFNKHLLAPSFFLDTHHIHLSKKNIAGVVCEEENLEKKDKKIE